MTHLQQLEQDLDAATHDGALHARTQIASAVDYLMHGLNFRSADVRAILEDLLVDREPRLAPVVSITMARRLVN